MDEGGGARLAVTSGLTHTRADRVTTKSAIVSGWAGDFAIYLTPDFESARARPHHGEHPLDRFLSSNGLVRSAAGKLYATCRCGVGPRPCLVGPWAHTVRSLGVSEHPTNRRRRHESLPTRLFCRQRIGQFENRCTTEFAVVFGGAGIFASAVNFGGDRVHSPPGERYFKTLHR
jgi:hypothetical protein